MKAFDLHLYSIGHSNHSAEAFLKLLQDQGIGCVADVRSAPYSRFHTQFNREVLGGFLQGNGISYVWMGDSLGGRMEGLTTEMGFRRDHAYDENETYRQGVVELMRLALKKKTAMMCSEEDPRQCHRHKIISQTILHRRIEECHRLGAIGIYHIRAGGHIEDARRIAVSFQPPLF